MAPLILAVLHDHPKVCQLLYERSAALNPTQDSEDPKECRALELSIHNKNMKVFRYLKSIGALPAQSSPEHVIPLCLEYGSLEMLDLCISQPLKDTEWKNHNTV
ncbi:hypothetical protein EDD86DRAFT_245087 [Gorgonomyces haynaldii]|nr:hypothetical protein EDD86DRAFT_245087 [Gorgonomyces haynaldii]